MICPKCNKQMQSEFETDTRNAHQYMAYYTCYKCGTACNQEILDVPVREDIYEYIVSA